MGKIAVTKSFIAFKEIECHERLINYFIPGSMCLEKPFTANSITVFKDF